MVKLFILCEGQSEEKFIKDKLTDSLLTFGVDVTAVPLKTSKGHSGGVSNFNKVKREIYILSHYSDAYITTMFDYYGFKCSDASFSEEFKNAKNIDECERLIESDLNIPHFRFYFSVYEYEALLFSNTEVFSMFGKKTAEEAQNIVRKYGGAEKIDTDYNNIPSHQLERLVPGYGKIMTGSKIYSKLDLETICDACPHFKAWYQWMTNLNSNHNDGH